MRVNNRNAGILREERAFIKLSIPKTTQDFQDLKDAMYAATFDNLNHNKLIKILWSFGVTDKRVLMMIKAMLKAGVMKDIAKNELGIPQGGLFLRF